MFRVDDSVTLKSSEGFGIEGSVVTFTLIKSRTNATKRSIPLIFNKTEGRFDEMLSLFQLLKNEGRLKGAYYLESAPDIRFTTKNFKDVLVKNPEFQKAFAKECYEVLSQYLSITRSKHTEDRSVLDSITGFFNDFANAMNSPEVDLA